MPRVKCFSLNVVLCSPVTVLLPSHLLWVKKLTGNEVALGGCVINRGRIQPRGSIALHTKGLCVGSRCIHTWQQEPLWETQAWSPGRFLLAIVWKFPNCFCSTQRLLHFRNRDYWGSRKPLNHSRYHQLTIASPGWWPASLQGTAEPQGHG